MKNDEFTKLFKYLTDRFDKVDKTLDQKADKSDTNKLLDLLDKLAKKQEIDDEERLVMGHQPDRFDRWVHEVADKIGHKLTV